MRTRKFPTILLVCLAALAWQVSRAESALQNPLPSTGQATGQAAQASDETAAFRATVDRYCVTCHNSRVTTPATASGVVLDRADLTRVADDPALWEKVVRKLRTGAMPPEGAPRPDRATHDALVGFIESRLDRAAVGASRTLAAPRSID